MNYNKYKRQTSSNRLKTTRSNKSAQNRQIIRQEPRVQIHPEELKYSDGQTSPTFASAGAVAAINMPSQGVTSSTRVADRLRCAELDFKLSVKLTSGTVDVIRFIVFQSTGLFPVVSPPSVSDVLQYSNVNSPYSYNVNQLFRIICDRTLTMSDNGDSQIQFLSDKCQLAIKQMLFVPGTTNVYSGQLWYLTIGTDATGQSSLLSWRFWFSDSN